METIQVLGFAGSLRQASHNRALLRVAQELQPEGMRLEIFDLLPIPLYNGDVETVGVPESVQEFKTKIRAADALLIVTPEYNYSVSGVLKNALDWASRPLRENPFAGKPLAIMGAGGMMGTIRAQMHLRHICVELNMFPLNKPEVMIQRPCEKFNAEGSLTDEPSRERVRALLQELVVWTHKLKG